MVRLKDIAVRAGVSVMTVSKAMRDARDISSSTKARIHQLAREMGYVPDSMAQGLRNRTTRLFGLVIPVSTHPIFSRVVMALEERAHAAGYDLIIGHSLNLPEREDAVIRRMISRRVDGLFVCPVYRLAQSVPIYEELTQLRIPSLVIGPVGVFCARFASVDVDDEPATYQATEYLIRLGHRRIAFFTGPVAATWAQARFEGFRRALRDHQIPIEDGLVFTAGSTIDEGEKAARDFLRESPKATAVFAVNDLVAIGAGKVLLEHGLAIPQDMSLLGFGNILTSEHFRVPMTTVHQPKYSLGEAAMDSMQALLAGGKPASRRLPAHLVIRASTASPRTTE